MRRFLLAIGMLSVPALLPGQQRVQPSDTTRVDKTFFTKRDLVLSGVALATSVAVSAFDERIATWSQTSRVQGSASRQSLFEGLTRVNEVPLTLGAIAAYGVGRFSGSNTITDVGLHTAESLILTVAISELLRGPIGRARPHESPGNAFEFRIGRGFTEFDHRSYPSMHAAVAFATASTLVGEIQLRRPEATRYAAPLLYSAAMIPGLTRIYLDQHWASDIVAGTLLGALLGSKVVRYAHSHGTNPVDRILMGTTIVPNGDGGVLVGLSLAH